MRCPRCQHDPPGMKFCGECAAPLASVCAACGAANPPDNKFCGQCAASLRAAAVKFPSPQSYTPKHLAEKILTSKAALEGERKEVTVLFADLKGSMELLADRDPEEARKLLDPVLERMMEAVHRYEGTVNQVMGDGIMALFGAPLAHEDMRFGRATRRCGCRSQSRSTRRVSSARTGCPSRSAWASTLARSSSAPSGRICTWITRRSVRRHTWPPAWSRWPRRARSCSPPRPCSSPKATFRSRPVGRSRSRACRPPWKSTRSPERAPCGPGSTRPPRGD